MGTGANGHLAIWGKWAPEKNGRNYKGNWQRWALATTKVAALPLPLQA